jgi:hypothetical protein
MHEDRDYDDLKRDDIAVYNFRGYTVLKFNKEHKSLEFGKHADMACFIKEDLLLMSNFLRECYDFSQGYRAEISHVEVD